MPILSTTPTALGELAETARLFIVRRIVPEDRGHFTPCWVWQGPKNEKGYARTEFGSNKNVRIHRLSYEAYIGPIPEGLQIDHLCRVTSCVNPAHLEPVTNEENARRNRKTHCKRGHEMVEENVYVCRNGKRSCRACNRERNPRRDGAPRAPCAPRLPRAPRPPITHCPRGHEYTLVNTQVGQDGRRRCRTCKRVQDQAYKARTRRRPAAGESQRGRTEQGPLPGTHVRTRHDSALHVGQVL